MKATALLSLLPSLSLLVAAQTNCPGTGYFCGRDLRLRSHIIYWCEDQATNPHVVADNCFEGCIPSPDPFQMPECVVERTSAPEQEPAPEPVPEAAPEGVPNPEPEFVALGDGVEGEVPPPPVYDGQ